MSNAELLAGKTPTLFEIQMSLLICRLSLFSVYLCYPFLFHLHILFRKLGFFYLSVGTHISLFVSLRWIIAA